MNRRSLPKKLRLTRSQNTKRRCKTKLSLSSFSSKRIKKVLNKIQAKMKIVSRNKIRKMNRSNKTKTATNKTKRVKREIKINSNKSSRVKPRTNRKPQSQTANRILPAIQRTKNLKNNRHSSNGFEELTTIQGSCSDANFDINTARGNLTEPRTALREVDKYGNLHKAMVFFKLPFDLITSNDFKSTGNHANSGYE